MKGGEEMMNTTMHMGGTDKNFGILLPEGLHI
jgi:hypothetical protein